MVIKKVIEYIEYNEYIRVVKEKEDEIRKLNDRILKLESENETKDKDEEIIMKRRDFEKCISDAKNKAIEEFRNGLKETQFISRRFT